MRLSPLQRFIVLEGYLQKKRLSKAHLLRYYESKSAAPSIKDQHGVIDKSVESLIARGFVRAHGTKTQEKWTLESVSLTREGRRVAVLIIETRGRLPLPKRRKKTDGV